MRQPPVHAMGTPRQRARHFRKIMNALPFYKTRLAKAREAMIQMENEIAELKLSLDLRSRVVDALAESLIEMRYGHTDKAEKMAIEALNYLAK